MNRSRSILNEKGLFDRFSRLRGARIPGFTSDQQILIILIGAIIAVLTIWRYFHLY